MHSKTLLLALALASGLGLSQAEDVLGVYIFHRHGDRTAKAWKPVNFTALGADEVHSSGAYYRSRYIESKADVGIRGISSRDAVLSQLDITSPVDAVLQNSASVFLQGLYPPSDTVEVLANGSKIERPLNGYQYIPINSVESAASAKDSESSAWLQGNSGCGNAEVSSNNYFTSPEYRQTYSDSEDFYRSLLPVINHTYGEDEANFKNAYTVFDLINVANIHNKSIPSADLLTKSTLAELYNLASVHEWNLAYNSSDKVRAIAGSVLGGQIVQSLDAIVSGKAKAPRFNAQFGAYGTFMAFFGLAQLDAADPDFRGVCDYASSMVFEVVTNSSSAKPSPEDVSVRFYFSNGTAAENEPKLYHLFGQKETMLKWADFKAAIKEFAIEDTDHWCQVCGNTEGTCASSKDSGSNASASSSSSGSEGGVSRPVAGVIGALVTLVVVLGVQAAVILLGGLRLVKKSTLAQAGSGPEMGVKA